MDSGLPLPNNSSLIVPRFSCREESALIGGKASSYGIHPETKSTAT